MMRKMAVWLVLGMAFLCASSSFAATSGPANVLVVYNSGNTRSVDLAHHYQTARGIADANLLALTTPASWADEGNTTINESDFFTYISDPITVAIAALEQAGGRIDYVVLCRNLPYLVTVPDSGPGGGSFDYPLDSQLMVVTLSFGFFGGFDSNFYDSTETFANYKANGSVNHNADFGFVFPFLVTRLDGWSWNDAFSLVDRAQTPRLQNAEAFLNPAAYWDDPKKGNFPFPNTQMRKTAAALTTAGVANELVSARFTAPKTPMSAYVSWANYDPTYAVVTLDRLVFAPGALAMTIGPNSGSDLRTRPKLSTKFDDAQFGQLIVDGVTGGIAPVVDGAFDDDPEAFAENYLINGWNLVDSLYSSVGVIGWELVIGDPLCTYLGPGFFVPGKGKGMKSGAAIGTANWGTTGKSPDDSGAPPSNNMTPTGGVGATSSWLHNGGGGSPGFGW
jgi:uncharacterized protein (TIGR03790 family)